jgi:hypothetical protein
VSPSWHDRYIAVLSPERVALVRRRRGWNDAFDLCADAACAEPTPAAATEALSGLLGRQEIGEGKLTVLLSNHFVRYLLVPWRPEVGSPAELAAYAEICCDQVFGSEAGRRIVLTSREKALSPRLAAVLDGAFLDNLRSVVEASRLSLASIQPYLSAAFNCMRESLDRSNFVFVVAEPARTCMLVSIDGCWSSVRASSGEDQPQALADLIEREALLLGVAEEDMPPVFVHAPRHADLKLPDCHGVTPETIRLPLPDTLAGAADPLLTMAMTVT